MRLKGFIVFLLLISTPASAEDRHPFVAGSFYPSDPIELGTMVDGFIEQASLPGDQGRLVALISPHAGFIYSGRTAGHVYKLLKAHPVETVVLVGPYHKAMFPGASIWKSGVWKTPLGDVPIDVELAQKIAFEDTSFRFTESAHAAEHSLETQLPFLQRTLTNFKIVPILVSDASGKNTSALAGAIHKHTAGKNVLVIASTDMSHYHPDDEARTMDARMLELMKEQDPAKIFEAGRSGKGELCGEAAVLTVLQYAGLLGSTTLTLLDYSTSGEASNDKTRVVGYGACALWQGGGLEPTPSILAQHALGPEQKRKLLALARQTVESVVRGEGLPAATPDEAVFKENKAVFVTVRKGEDLRGCIGRLLAEEPLFDAVRHMAVESALKDPRFPPVTPEELPGLHYEVSVLSEPLRAKDVAEFKMGTHGVILRQGDRSGVFLPKVAEAFDWDKEMFLDELCIQKAALPDDCWKDPRTELYLFTADEFSEPAE